jgi:APA family basic amino acid/polyamine antiporter
VTRTDLVTASEPARGPAFENEPETELPRTVSTFDAASMLLAIVVGAGIYSAPQVLARELGDLRWIFACWLAGALLVWLGALVYAEVGTRLPATGGELVYLRTAYGDGAAALFGWLSFFLISPSARVGLALVAADYLTAGRTGEGVRVAVAATLIVTLCALHVLGARPSLGAQRALVAVKLVGLAVLVGAASQLPARELVDAPAAIPALPALAASMLLVFFSYLGWAKVGYVAGEMKSARRTLPWALLVGMAVVAALYLAVVASYHLALGTAGVAASPAVAAEAAEVALGAWGRALVVALVVASTVGSLTGSILADSRLFLAMARAGSLFRWLDALHPRFRSPARILGAHAAVCLVLLAVRQSTELTLSAMVAGRLLFIGLVGVALFRLRRLDVGRGDGFRVPLFPALPALFVAGVALLLAGRLVFQAREALIDLAVVAGALPLLLAERWWRSRAVLPARAGDGA